MRHGHGLLSRSARRAAPTLAGAVLCAVGLGGFGGCGDGGSSGFDIAASQRQEQEVIAEARDEAQRLGAAGTGSIR